MLILFIGCGDSSSDGNELSKHPGYEYMPNMYRSPSYETYSVNPNFSDSMTARKPVTGTIPRGFIPFEYENTLDDYLSAGKELINQLRLTLTMEKHYMVCFVLIVMVIMVMVKVL
jgi:hypothetical protein